jgi:hypothetical protein
VPPLPPNFVIIGAQKAGTRWLRVNLDCHPEVFADVPELAYFSSNRYSQGIDWYRSRFEGWDGQPIVGEATPAYMMATLRPERTAQRIDEQLPGARLFAVLRDPCERAYSGFLHHAKRGRVAVDADLLEYVRTTPPENDPLHIIAGGWYARSLTPYFERFGSRLCVLLNDDIKNDPALVYARALEHLGLQTGYLPPELDKVRFSNDVRKESRYAGADGRRRSMNEHERAALYPYFADDINRLEQMLGRDLSGWRPSG